MDSWNLSKRKLMGNVVHPFLYGWWNEAHKEKKTLPTGKRGGGSIRPWSCFAASGTGGTERIRGRAKPEDGRGILDRNVSPSVRKLGLRRSSWVLWRDNDPKLTSSSIKEGLERKRWTVWYGSTISPHLNPTGKLWGELKSATAERTSANLKELEHTAMEE